MCALCPHLHSLALTHFTLPTNSSLHFIPSIQFIFIQQHIPSKSEQKKTDAALTLSPSSFPPFPSVHIIHSRALSTLKTQDIMRSINALSLSFSSRPSCPSIHRCIVSRVFTKISPDQEVFPLLFWTLSNNKNCGFFFLFSVPANLLVCLRRLSISPSTPPSPLTYTCGRAGARASTLE